MNKLDIKDRPGTLPKERIRLHFERTVVGTPPFKQVFANLETVEKDGVFQHYKDEATDAFWFGFAIGMRCSERIAKAGEQP